MIRDNLSKVSIYIPALKALVSGLFISLVALSLGAILELEPLWAYGLGAFSISSTAFWFKYSSSMLEYLERLLDLDINRDGYIGEPGPQEPSWDRSSIITVLDEREKSGSYSQLPLPDKTMREIALLYLKSGSFSTRSFTGAGGPITQTEFNQLRDYLIHYGGARYRNEAHPTQGLVLTKKGEALLKAFLPSPTLAG